MDNDNIFSEKEKNELEYETEELIKQLKESGNIHIAGNWEINYLCKDCIIREFKQFNKTIKDLRSEYKLLREVKDEEIRTLKDINLMLREEIKSLKKHKSK